MAQLLSADNFSCHRHAMTAAFSASAQQSLLPLHNIKNGTCISIPRIHFQKQGEMRPRTAGISMEMMAYFTHKTVLAGVLLRSNALKYAANMTDWKITRNSFPKHIEGHAMIQSSGFYHRRGPSKSDRFRYGTWFFSTLQESTTETKVSDIDNTNDHASTPVEDLLPSLDAVVVEAAERVAETVEVAVQTVSSVGEIEGQLPLEHAAKDEAMAVRTVVFWVCAAVCFGLIIGLKEGTDKASEFFTGYLVEQSLSVDNLVVFVVIFKYFCVPLAIQSRVLTYGISGAIVFRAIMILLGVATIKSFEAVNLFFASILIFSSYKLLAEEEEDEEDLSKNYIVNICRRFIPVTAEYDGNRFFTKIEGPVKATPLFLTLAVVELSDIAFAVDSIPAVFGVTRDPLIVLSSNIFAILGLRSLYTLISSRMDELDYLQPAVAVVLGFIGSKMIADFFGFHTSVEVSLGVVISVLGTGVGLSLWKNKHDDLK